MTRIKNMTEAEIEQRLQQYSFYHSIQLTERLTTPGWPVVRSLVDMTLRNLRTLDWKGKRVLDIGCRDCIFSFEAERLGASEIIAIDNDPSVAASEFLIPALGSRVKMLEMNLMDLTPQHLGKFDVIIFAGVLYHLRYPFWALKLIRDMLNQDGQLILETAVYLDDNRLPLLLCPIGNESPYEPTSCTFYNTKGLTDTLFSMGLTVQHVEYLNYRPEQASVTAPQEKAGPPTVDRATLLCQMTPQIINPQVTSYWDGTHQIHSTYQTLINAEPINLPKSRAQERNQLIFG